VLSRLLAASNVFNAYLPSSVLQGLAEMAHNMKFVEQNRGLRRMRLRRQSKRLPHAHHWSGRAPGVGRVVKSRATNPH